MNASSDVFSSTVVTPSLPLLPGQTGKDRGVAGTPKPPEGKEGKAVAAGLAADKTKRTAPEATMQDAVQKVNEALEAFDATALQLSYDRERELVMIKVVKAAANPGEKEKVIRQIPPEELLRLAETLEEVRGVLFNQRV